MSATDGLCKSTYATARVIARTGLSVARSAAVLPIVAIAWAINKAIDRPLPDEADIEEAKPAESLDSL